MTGTKDCPTPKKRRYATWEAAYEHMLRQQNEVLGTDLKPLTQVYACRCEWWHLSSAEPRDTYTPPNPRKKS